MFEQPDGERLERILLPVPTKRTKGVLVFPTLDGKLVAGPTAVDLSDKYDWSVRPRAHEEILPKAIAMYPPLEGATAVAAYAGLRPAGRDRVNYLIAVSRACPRLVNVAAIRSTGLTASLGIAELVARARRLAGRRAWTAARAHARPAAGQPGAVVAANCRARRRVTLLLGIDEGTSAVKAVLYDGDLRPLAQARREKALTHPQPGWVEQDPLETLDAVVDAVAVGALRGAGGGHRLRPRPPGRVGAGAGTPSAGGR